MFIDRVKLDLRAGKGGNGVVAWRREKYIPKGGPSGGNGGKGGSIYIQADTQLYSLESFRNQRILKAENGRNGSAKSSTGRNGGDLVLKVPCGTLVKNIETNEILHDLTQDKEKILLCKGGKGGKGNEHFKSPTNRAPNQQTNGDKGEDRHVELELKLIADVGLVGFPNAGKSTIISKLADMRVKIAPYPFTTLQPNLGFLSQENGKRIFIADIPGIIEGAHQNRGLGLEFLRHIERTELLIFVLDASGIDGRNPMDDFRVLKDELEAYHPDLLKRSYLVALNKIDTEESVDNLKAFRKKFRIPKGCLFEISAERGDGMSELEEAIKSKF